MSDEPPSKRQCRPPRRFPWCDNRFRCIHCPKALGRDGRGFSRARDVPCSNPDIHLTVNDKDNCDRYWLSDPNAVHFDLPLGRELNRATGDAAKPGPDGWCVCSRTCSARPCRLAPTAAAAQNFNTEFSPATFPGQLRSYRLVGQSEFRSGLTEFSDVSFSIFSIRNSPALRRVDSDRAVCGFTEGRPLQIFEFSGPQHDNMVIIQIG